jgi:hypothetical protein
MTRNGTRLQVHHVPSSHDRIHVCGRKIVHTSIDINGIRGSSGWWCWY